MGYRGITKKSSEKKKKKLESKDEFVSLESKDESSIAEKSNAADDDKQSISVRLVGK